MALPGSLTIPTSLAVDSAAHVTRTAPLLRRVLDAIVEMQRLRAERHIVLYLRRNPLIASGAWLAERRADGEGR